MVHKVFHDLHSLILSSLLDSTTPLFSTLSRHAGLLIILTCQAHSFLTASVQALFYAWNSPSPDSSWFIPLPQSSLCSSLSFRWRLLGCQIRPLLFRFVLEVLMNAMWQEKGSKRYNYPKSWHEILFHLFRQMPSLHA